MTIRITKKVSKQIKRRHFKVRSKVSKQKRKIFVRSLSYIGILFTAIALTYVAGHTISKSNLFKVQKINVYGLNSISYADFNQKINEKYANLVIFKANSIASYLKNAFPEIKSIKLRYSMPGTISFYVTERNPIACTVINAGTYYLDEENTLFKLNVSSSVIVPEIAMVFDSDKSREGIIRFVDILKKDYNWLYTKIRLVNMQENDIILITHSNLKILWGLASKDGIKDRVNYLNKVINFKPKEYIDLRFCDYSRVIVK